MSNECTRLEAELIYARQEANRKIADELERLSPSRLSTWSQVLALSFMGASIASVADNLVLTITEKFMLAIGFIWPIGHLIYRLSRAEARLALLTKLLRSNAAGS